jgi:PIN domain nuclease of toxin-antitoxin system
VRRVLLDAHALIWAVEEPSKLGSAAESAIRDPEVDRLVGAGTIWEIAIKVGKGRLPLSLPFLEWIEKAFDELAIELLPITPRHCAKQIVLPPHHGDPFDRILAAQALEEGIEVVSSDEILDAYGVVRIWK